MGRSWLPTPETAEKPLEVLPNNDRKRSEKMRAAEYTLLYEKPASPERVLDARRYVDEVLCELKEGSSLFIFGCGHSIISNTIREKTALGRIVATDVVSAAAQGLDSSIEFRILDFLEDELEVFDYIFSSHTIEHFSRDDLLNVVLPKALRHARKAVIFIAPYKTIAWGGEDAHRVSLAEDDELAAQALKWKRIRDNPTATPPQFGIELVLWFEGRAK